MIGISEKQNTIINKLTDYDFNLGIAGYKYSDLFDAVKLRTDSITKISSI